MRQIAGRWCYSRRLTQFAIIRSGIAKAAMCTLRVMGNRKGLQGSAKKDRRSHARQDNLPHLPSVILIIAHTFMTGLSGQFK